MKQAINDNQRLCPICGKDDQVIDISYGLPIPLEKALEDEANGKIKLGGCMMIRGAHQPIYHCKRDALDFGDLDKTGDW